MNEKLLTSLGKLAVTIRFNTFLPFLTQHDIYFMEIRLIWGEYAWDVFEWIDLQAQKSIYPFDHWFRVAVRGGINFPISQKGWEERKDNVRSLIESLSN